jgi:Zn-dependent M28 family amino/carboxypeptidase
LIFCSWGAEEYGLIGSYEWAEENAKVLSQRAVAYLNVDIAVAGIAAAPNISNNFNLFFLSF